MAKKKNIKKTEKKAEIRPPVVTIMGHVDHGKTTLLDVIRETNLQAKESGGITQSIGAYQVEVETENGKKKITFIDTPGHEAFTAMRARGANITDIVVLVVAANDGVKPQTIEAINHAKKAEVPIIVAVNKIDLPSANPDKVKEQLAKYELLSEDWGGQTIFVNISAKKKTNIKELLEMILLVAEMEELKIDMKAPFSATVIESHLDSKQGATASVLVQSGELKVGERVFTGQVEGKIRSMRDDKGKMVKAAGISMPVELFGFKEIPGIGEKITKEKPEKEKLNPAEKNKSLSLNELFQKADAKEVDKLKLILKAENQGCLEALTQYLQGMMEIAEKVEIVHQGCGAITESDVLLAKVSEADILGFRIKAGSEIVIAAEEQNVSIRTFEIIYKLIEEIQNLLLNRVEKKKKEYIMGKATVKAVFKSSKGTKIAGIRVTEGLLRKNKKIRVLRNEENVHEAQIESLKHIKEDVSEIKSGAEGGITVIPDFGFEKGDTIESYREN